jgi:CRP/FNR family cyclic AMP-dependent transcriptional regulator
VAPGSAATIPPRLRAAWTQSFLADLPAEVVSALLKESYEAQIPAGETIHRELFSPGPAHLMLVLAGLVRVYRTSPEGRQLTLRHARTGDVIGTPSVVADTAPAGVQAVTRCNVLHLPVATFRYWARRDPTVSWAMAREMSRSLFGIQERMIHNVFASMRGRVARHLVDLAETEGPHLVVKASHQDLADALGSVREVVGRIMSAFRDEGLVERGRSGIILRDRDTLAALAREEPALIMGEAPYREFPAGPPNGHGNPASAE